MLPKYARISFESIHCEPLTYSRPFVGQCRSDVAGSYNFSSNYEACDADAFPQRIMQL